MNTFICKDENSYSRWSYILTLLLLVAFFVVGANSAVASNEVSISSPEASFIVRVIDDDCWRITEPRQASYSSVNEAVKDTIPGEWWPPTGYGVTMVNGALDIITIYVITEK